MTTLAIRAIGRPAPQGSHEVGANGHVMHSSQYLAAWRRQVAIATLTAVKAAGYAPGSLPLFGPRSAVYVHELVLIVQDDQCRAAGTDEPTGRPDVDKLLRATIDGLGDAHLFADDSQIVKIHELSKVRPELDELTGAVIVISDRPRPVITQGESMSASIEQAEYRITLERVTGRDADGYRTTEPVVELHGPAAVITTAGLTTIGALLGAGSVSVADAPAATAEPADDDAKPARRGPGRPRKQAAAPAEPQPMVAVPLDGSETIAEPVAAAARPMAVVSGEQQVTQNVETATPVAPAERYNPFARQ